MSVLIDDFTGKDLILSWTRDPANDQPGIVFRDYQIDFVVDDVVVRTETTEKTSITYYFDDMVADQGTNAPSRTVSVRLRERDTWLRKSEDAQGTFTNPAPTAVSFTAQPFLVPSGSSKGKIMISITPSLDDDLLGYQIFRGTSSGFTPAVSNRIYKGKSNIYFDDKVNADTTYYYKVAAYDMFSTTVGSLVFGSAVESQGTFALKLSDIKVKDVVFTPNSPADNRLTWSGGTAYWQEMGNTSIITKDIPSGYNAASTDERYIYLDWDAGIIKTTTNIVTAYSSANNRILATYKGGTDLIDGIDKPIIDGSKILAHTIGAAQLVTTSAIITGTAQIANAVITNSHVLNLNASKITAGYLDVNRIEAKSIDADKLATDSIRSRHIKTDEIIGRHIAAKEITTNHMAFGSIDGNRITTNTLNGNRITANTVTADKIKFGTLTGDLMKSDDLIIRHGAQIKNLTVDTIHIKDKAIGWTRTVKYTDRIHLSKGYERTLCKFTVPSGVSGQAFLSGTWMWESDDKPKCKYIIRKNGAVIFEYYHDYGISDASEHFATSIVTEIAAGDVMKLSQLWLSSGDDVQHLFSQLSCIITRK